MQWMALTVGVCLLSLFLVTGLVGRFIRFGALAASPRLLSLWWF